MTQRRDEPPPHLRSEVNENERAAIAAAVGPLAPELLRPIRDGRGQQFQRLEFLGDSVMDLALAVHALIEPACSNCLSVAGDVGRLVTDHALASQATAGGFGGWLEWQASPERLADLVEAAAAAAWLQGGWSQAFEVINGVVHPLSPLTLKALATGGLAADQGSTSKALRRVGASLLELAASQLVYRAAADADEGELSRRRAELHRATRIAEYARDHHVGTGKDDSVLSDAVEELLAQRLLSAGADLALDEATAVLK